jgi:DnaD/phage-associated family protein
MDGFSGFPEGKLKLTRIPDLFFSELLPLIDDLSELKVTLHCLWLLHQKQGDMRHTTLAELAGDEILMRGLEGADLPARDALVEGIERAVARGTLLQVTVQRPERPDEIWYFLNSERGRDAVERIARGEWTPPDEAGPVYLRARRPNIFNLYEQNLGLIQSPLLVEELKDAEQTYPAEWIADAFRLAVNSNVRRWSYVRRILERWAQEGRAGHGRQRGDDAKTTRRRYAEEYDG